MTKENLFALVQKAGMTPVPIMQEGDGDDTINFFEGNLDQFLSVAKTIGATACFIQDNVLEKWDFLYNPFQDEESNEGSPDVEIDLSEISPALAKFRQYLGENYRYHLIAKGGVDDLWFVVDQEWWADFEDEVERAEGKAVLALRARNN